MRNRFSRRQIGLVLVAGALACYGALYFSGSSAESAPVEAVTRPTGDSKNAVNRPDINKLAGVAVNLSKAMEPSARASLSQAPVSNLFASNSWTPPPPPAPKAPPPPPPPPPTAPPLPFSFVGMLEDQARPTAFLARDEQLLLVTAGDTLDGTYHVDSVSASEIVFTYLPLKQRQSISISGAY